MLALPHVRVDPFALLRGSLEPADDKTVKCSTGGDRTPDDTTLVGQQLAHEEKSRLPD